MWKQLKQSLSNCFLYDIPAMISFRQSRVLCDMISKENKLNIGYRIK